MSASLTLKGDKELLRKLKQLEPKVGKKVARKALRAGAKIAAKEIKQNAPVGTGPGEHGSIPAAVKVKAGKRSRRRIQVNAQIGEGDFKGDTFYASFVEFGTSKQPPQNFIEESFDSKAEQIERKIMSELAKGIESVAK